jgi:hypothetical protein
MKLYRPPREREPGLQRNEMSGKLRTPAAGWDLTLGAPVLRQAQDTVSDG